MDRQVFSELFRVAIMSIAAAFVMLICYIAGYAFGKMN